MIYNPIYLHTHRCIHTHTHTHTHTYIYIIGNVFPKLNKISLKYNLSVQTDDNGKAIRGVEDDTIAGCVEG